MFVAGGYDVLGRRSHGVQDALAVKTTNEPRTDSDWKPTAGNDICLSAVVSSKRLMDYAPLLVNAVAVQTRSFVFTQTSHSETRHGPKLSPWYWHNGPRVDSGYSSCHDTGTSPP